MLNISRFSSPSFSAKDSNSHSRRRWTSLTKSVLGVALAMGVLTAGQAQALVVNVPGYGSWDVTTFTGTYNANVSKFATADNGGVMPWWGNADLATSFALRVNHSLSSMRPLEYNGNLVGPLFAHKISAANLGDTPGPQAYVKVGFRLYSEFYQSTGNLLDVTWAQAVAYQAPASSVPGPLPALGAAAAFGFSRQLRRRIKQSTNPVSNS
jgi:hypothetical protein